MRFFPFTSMLSIAPCSIFPSSSSYLIPFRLLCHIFSFSLSSNNLKSLQCLFSHISGGNSFLSLKRLKCSFSILSIPEGNEGNIPCGLFHFQCKVSQKHLGHSSIKLNDEGDSLYVILF